MQALRGAWPVVNRPITSEGNAPVAQFLGAIDSLVSSVSCESGRGHSPEPAPCCTLYTRSTHEPRWCPNGGRNGLIELRPGPLNELGSLEVGRKFGRSGDVIKPAEANVGEPPKCRQGALLVQSGPRRVLEPIRPAAQGLISRKRIEALPMVGESPLQTYLVACHLVHLIVRRKTWGGEWKDDDRE